MSTNKKLIRAFAANFGHKMLMMFQLCQVMVMISFSSSITLLASDQLHPAEALPSYGDIDQFLELYYFACF
ncbi:hypothetical protein BDE02_11G060900 [Populus trichocarpa]|nr:hypothetical protein BDE02_11G060900 [Populus trichocarpa]